MEFGKEYFVSKFYFEDEYLDGEKNGVGKEYNSKVQLIFEGGYLKGVKNDFGKGNVIRSFC